VNCVCFTQSSDQRCALLNTEMNFWFHETLATSWLAKQLYAAKDVLIPLGLTNLLVMFLAFLLHYSTPLTFRYAILLLNHSVLGKYVFYRYLVGSLGWGNGVLRSLYMHKTTYTKKSHSPITKTAFEPAFSVFKWLMTVCAYIVQTLWSVLAILRPFYEAYSFGYIFCSIRVEV
jgi:hypothetical protein